MGLFNITWRTQVTNILAVAFRSVSVIDFITSLLEPLKTKALEYNAFDTEIRKRAKFNGQVIVLREALNNIFGITSSPFILVETQSGIGTLAYIYNNGEGFNPVFIYNSGEGSTTYIFNSSEITDGFNIIIKIPIGIYTVELERQISSEVKTYKLAGKSFKIETY